MEANLNLLLYLESQLILIVGDFFNLLILTFDFPERDGDWICANP